MLIVAGSTSPEEIEATKQAFSNYYTDFQIEAVSIERGVYEVLRDGVGRPEQVFEPLAERAAMEEGAAPAGGLGVPRVF
jgi:hypothetical protein